MRNTLKWSLLAAVGILAGAFFAVLDPVLVSPFWESLPISGNVFEFLKNRFPEVFAGQWSLVSDEVPRWLLLIFNGMWIGKVSGRRWTVTSFFFLVGFLVIPHLTLWVLEGPHPWSILSSLLVISAILWNIVGIPALLIGVAASVKLHNAPMLADRRFSIRGFLLLITLAAVLMCLMAFSVNIALPLAFQVFALSVAYGVLVARSKGTWRDQRGRG